MPTVDRTDIDRLSHHNLDLEGYVGKMAAAALMEAPTGSSGSETC
jgi:hypothetical protein